MNFDFSAINDEKVGYRLVLYPGAESCDSGPFMMIPVTFREAWDRREAKTPQDALKKLEDALNYSREQHDLDVTQHATLAGHIVAVTVLSREAKMNAMNLIKAHYLEGQLAQYVGETEINAARKKDEFERYMCFCESLEGLVKARLSEEEKLLARGILKKRAIETRPSNIGGASGEAGEAD
jgi:hypothetical protein